MTRKHAKSRETVDTSAQKRSFPEEVLDPHFAGQCAGCGRLVLFGRWLGDVLYDLDGRNRELLSSTSRPFEAAKMMRGAGVHLKLSSLQDCAACWQRRRVDDYKARGLSVLAMLADADVARAEALYQSPAYLHGESEARAYLEKRLARLQGHAGAELAAQPDQAGAAVEQVS